LGITVRVVAAIGQDRFGQFIRDRIRAEGLDDSGLITLPNGKTSTSIVLVQGTGERRFLLSCLFLMNGHDAPYRKRCGTRKKAATSRTALSTASCKICM
jgi:hypothetical protein